MQLEKYKTMDEALECVMKEKGIGKTNATKYLRSNIPLESHYQTKIIDYLRKEYPDSFVTKFTAGYYSMGGVPDVLFILEGHYFGFEVKRPFFGIVSKKQTKAIEKIRNAGGTADVVTYISDVQRVIADWERERG